MIGFVRGPSLEGRHPCFFRFEHPVELATRGDVELAVGACEMALDCLDGQKQLLGDLAVRAPFARESHDAQLTRR